MILSAHDRPRGGVRCMNSALYGMVIAVGVHWNQYPKFLNNFLFVAYRRCPPKSRNWYEFYVWEFLKSAVDLQFVFGYPIKPELRVNKFHYWNEKENPMVVIGDYIWNIFGIERVEETLFEHFKQLKEEHPMSLQGLQRNRMGRSNIGLQSQ